MREYVHAQALAVRVRAPSACSDLAAHQHLALQGVSKHMLGQDVQITSGYHTGLKHLFHKCMCTCMLVSDMHACACI